MTMHTPGPWTVRPDPPQFEPIIYAGEIFVARAYATADAQANAHLIAAAPDMLAALQGILGPDGNTVYATRPLIAAIRDAITKATRS